MVEEHVGKDRELDGRRADGANFVLPDLLRATNLPLESYCPQRDFLVVGQLGVRTDTVVVVLGQVTLLLSGVGPREPRTGVHDELAKDVVNLSQTTVATVRRQHKTKPLKGHFANIRIKPARLLLVVLEEILEQRLIIYSSIYIFPRIAIDKLE
jgi:hypothetical protein